jgi:type IV secretory pathway VirB10-like protein
MGSSPYDMGGDPGGGPDGLHLRTAPRTTRLNRNALIALVLVGAFVLVAAAVTLVQNRTAIAPAGDASMATATSHDRFWQDRSDGVAAYEPEPTLPDVSAPPPSEPNVVPVAVPPGDSGATSRQQRILRAMDSSPKVSAFQTSRVSYGATAAPGTMPSSRGGAPAGETSAVADALRDALAPKDPTELQNNQAGKKAFLAGAKLAEEDETNPYLVREAISAFEVTAGMILPAVLIDRPRPRERLRLGHRQAPARAPGHDPRRDLRQRRELRPATPAGRLAAPDLPGRDKAQHRWDARD